MIEKAHEIEIGMQQVFADYFLETSTSLERDAAVRAFEINVRGLFIFDKTIRYPCDWWQAFKERWFPKFVLNRWPVRHVEYYIKSTDKVLTLGNN